jgi:S-DNA-T family DNA segregation ATPase FtsK/SpoIIIE
LVSAEGGTPFMTLLMRVFTPGKSRRLNELIGFLLLVCASLLLLALVSYSPLDPSLNTAGSLGSRTARNWIGLFGALASDLLLQSAGICAFSKYSYIFFFG